MIGGSLLWPLVMKQSRPPVLQAVHDKVVETEAGKKAEEILGVQNGPIDVQQAVGSVSSQLVTQAGNTVQKKIEEIVTQKVVEEVVKRFDTLPNANKEEVKALICKPAQ